MSDIMIDEIPRVYGISGPMTSGHGFNITCNKAFRHRFCNSEVNHAIELKRVYIEDNRLHILLRRAEFGYGYSFTERHSKRMDEDIYFVEIGITSIKDVCRIYKDKIPSRFGMIKEPSLILNTDDENETLIILPEELPFMKSRPKYKRQVRARVNPKNNKSNIIDKMKEEMSEEMIKEELINHKNSINTLLYKTNIRYVFEFDKETGHLRLGIPKTELDYL